MLRLAGVALLMAGAAQAQQAVVLQPGEVLLEVDALGEVKSAPDQATVLGGVVTQADTARGAIEANNVQMERVVRAIRAAGIEGRQLQTESVSISPRYSEPPPNFRGGYFRREIVGYDARNSVSVQLRDTAKLSALLDAMTAAGANEIYGPNFALVDPRPMQLKARGRAVAEANAQAAALAEAAGLRIARVLRISERGGPGAYYAPAPESPPPPPAPAVVVTGSRAPVETGEITTAARVSIDYALVPR